MGDNMVKSAKMEFVSVSDFRIHPGKIWDKLKDQDLVVTPNLS